MRSLLSCWNQGVSHPRTRKAYRPPGAATTARSTDVFLERLDAIGSRHAAAHHAIVEDVYDLAGDCVLMRARVLNELPVATSHGVEAALGHIRRVGHRLAVARDAWAYCGAGSVPP